MDFSLVDKLTKKWSKNLPGKGYELVRQDGGLSPCAQSEAIMLSKGMGVMDFQAFLKGGMTRHRGSDNNLDRITARTLKISVVHSILLRRFNDLSSQSPAIVLNEPERVLGKNFRKVLEFWHFVDSMSQEKWKELLKKPLGVFSSDEYTAKKVALKALTENLEVIVPDLYYLIGGSRPLDPSLIVKRTEEEMAEITPEFEVYNSSNQHAPRCIMPDSGKVVVVGDYSRAYFGWIAPYDYFLSNSPFPPLTNPNIVSKLQVLFACATNEIQVLNDNQTYDDLYFCKIIGYDPTKNYTFDKISRKIEEYKNSLADVVERIYLISNNYLFSCFSKDPEVKREATKEMVEGLLELTEVDLLNERAYEKIKETFEVGKGRFFGTLHVRVPKLGANTEADSKFYQLTQKLKEDYEMWPLSYCDKENSSSEQGSEWAIRSNKDQIRPRFNAPRGFDSPGA
jgi:hypothetical protein